MNAGQNRRQNFRLAFFKKQFADYFEWIKIESGRPQFIKNQPNVQNTVTIVRFVAIVYKVVS